MDSGEKKSSPIGKSNISASMIENTQVYVNLDQDAIVVTADRIELVLNKYLKVIASKTDWHAPAGLLFTIITTLATSNFQITLGVSAETIKAFFLLAALFAAMYLVKTIIIAYNSRGCDVQTIITSLKRSSSDPSITAPDAVAETTMTIEMTKTDMSNTDQSGADVIPAIGKRWHLKEGFDFEQTKNALNKQLDTIQQAMDVNKNRFENSTVRSYLLIYSWFLTFNASKPGRGKRISFKISGDIGIGRNANENTWRVIGEQLEILNDKGQVFSRFKYDSSSRIFSSTSDKDQLIDFPQTITQQV